MIMINKTIKQSVECGEAELNYPIGTNLWHATIVYTYIYIYRTYMNVNTELGSADFGHVSWQGRKITL